MVRMVWERRVFGDRFPSRPLFIIRIQHSKFGTSNNLLNANSNRATELNKTKQNKTETIARVMTKHQHLTTYEDFSGGSTDSLDSTCQVNNDNHRSSGGSGGCCPETLKECDHIFICGNNNSNNNKRNRRKTNSGSRSNSPEHAIYIGYGGNVHWVVYSKNNQVVQTSLEQFLDGRDFRVAQYGSSILDCFWNKAHNTMESNDAHTVRKRVFEALEDQGHPHVTRDSLTFSRYCKTGKARVLSLSGKHERRERKELRRMGTMFFAIVGAGLGLVFYGLLGLVVASVAGGTISYLSFTIFQ